MFLQFDDCDPNFRDRDQMTPLHLAVKHKNPDMVYTLLSEDNRKQADPNMVNRNGQTALHMAAATGEEEIIRIISRSNLDEPCDPTILDAQQLTACQIARANHHETCVKLIQEYEQNVVSSLPRRTHGNVSINEQEINPILSDNRKGFIGNDDSTDDSSSTAGDSSSQQSNLPAKQYTDRIGPLSTQPKQETRTLADMIKSNPLQPDIPKPAATNQTLASMIKSIPLQQNESSPFGISPTFPPDNSTSSSFSMTKGIIGTNIIAGQPVTTPSATTTTKNVTLSALVNSLPQPDSTRSTSDSWPQDSTYAHQPVRQAQRVDNTWDSSSSAHSDEENSTYHAPAPSTNLTKPPTLNGTAMFTTPILPNNDSDESRSDEDSIEAAVKELNTRKAALGIENLVNKQVVNPYKPPPPPLQPQQQSSLFNIQSPASEDSSWTTSSVTAHKEPGAIQSLVQQQPLIAKKTSEALWDDSRPLSADFKQGSFSPKKVQQNSSSSTSSDTSDLDDDENKSSTIVKSPLTHLVQQNIQPVESNKPTGVENLAKIMESMMHRPVLIQKQ